MKLVIHADLLRNEALSQAIHGCFDERGGTIGRSENNTLALPDPERHVSRLQAEVMFAGQAFSIRNVGSANPIQLNDRSLKPGEAAPLVPGDRLVIGGYSMRVALDADTEADVAPRAAPMKLGNVVRASAGEPKTDPPLSVARRAAAARAHSNAASGANSIGASIADPFVELAPSGSPAAADDPFADLLEAPPPIAVAQRRAPPPQRSAPPPAAVRPAGDADPFAELGAAPPAREDADATAFDASLAPSKASVARADAGLDDLFGLGGAGAGSVLPPSSLDAMFGLEDKATHEGAGLLDEFLSSGTQLKESTTGDLVDLFTAKSSSGGANVGMPARPAGFNHTPDLASAYAPPAVRPAVGAKVAVARQPPMPAAEPPRARAAPVQRPVAEGPRAGVEPEPSPNAPPAQRAAAAVQGSASPQALWQAFCEGAGISLSLPQDLNPQMMSIMGQVMHHAVEGTLKLMAVRAAAKQELRAQVTTIQSKNNNPLKFSVDPQAALLQLLQPPMRGFMSGPDAVRDAMDDLLGHSIGTMAGTRAALHGVLKRFEPKRLEGKLAGGGVIDSLLPMSRRANLWELYVEHFQKVQDDAQEDFHQLFGQAFVEAYEKQLDRLEAARNKKR